MLYRHMVHIVDDLIWGDQTTSDPVTTFQELERKPDSRIGNSYVGHFPVPQLKKTPNQCDITNKDYTSLAIN